VPIMSRPSLSCLTVFIRIAPSVSYDEIYKPRNHFPLFLGAVQSIALNATRY